MRHSKADLVRLAHHCACTVLENCLEYEFNEEQIANALSRHCSTSCFMSEISGKDCDYVLDEAEEFFYGRLVRFIQRG